MASLPWIEILHLESCENVTDVSFAQVAILGNLTELRVFGGKQLTDQGLQGLARLTKLRRLSLRYCAGLTDRTVDELIGLAEPRGTRP